MIHRHYKKLRERKILLTALVLILLGVLMVVYLNISSVSIVGNPQIVATNTPAINKARSVTEPVISVTPLSIQQGEPALITVEGLTSTSGVKSFTIDNRPLVIFLHEGQVTALFGVDLWAVPGTLPLVLTLKDGKQIRGNLTINQRTRIEVPFDIPKKLGGNTPESVGELISTRADEAKIINAIPTSNEKLWTEPFGPPLKGVAVVLDNYGYTRIIDKSIMPHKGTDLEAPIGTPVYAMNRGVVKFTNYLRNYGNTVIIDHGKGLQTVYMHLSKVKATDNQTVERGELIGMSGDTGYVLGPHLHFSVRIWDISIDPMKFLELLGSEN